MTAVSAFSAMRRGSRKLGKQEPFQNWGMRSSTVPVPRLPVAVPTAVALTVRSGFFSPAPVAAPTFISRSAAKPIISRKRIGVRGLLHERAQVSSWHRSSVLPSNQVGVGNPTLIGEYR